MNDTPVFDCRLASCSNNGFCPQAGGNCICFAPFSGVDCSSKNNLRQTLITFIENIFSFDSASFKAMVLCIPNSIWLLISNTYNSSYYNTSSDTLQNKSSYWNIFNDYSHRNW